MALIVRVYQDPDSNLHLVYADESNPQPVPDDWTFMPGGEETFYATNHANLVSFQTQSANAQAAFLEAQAAAQANREAVLGQIASATGISADALIGALTDTPQSWLVPPADQLSLQSFPLLSAQVDATGVWSTPSTLTVTVSHKAEAAGLNTVFATLIVDVGLGTETSELLTLTPEGSEIRTFEGATTVDLREGTDPAGQLLGRWQPSAGSTPAWAPVPVADDPASDVKPVALESVSAPAGETVIRPTRRPRQTGRPDNASPTA